MSYDQLNLNSHKTAKRVGRGISAGGGKTAGRGTKGQKARKSGNVRPGFEGGQTPLAQKLPKLRGFSSKRIKAENVYTSQLALVSGKTADTTTLAAAGVISNPYVRAKLVVNGDVSKAVTVKLPAASAAAIAAVKKAGGSFEAVPQLGRKSSK